MAVESHVDAVLQSWLEERLKRADPVHGTVAGPTESHGTPGRYVRLVPGPRDRQRLPLRQTGKPARRPQLRRDPLRLAELAPRGENRQCPVRSRRNARRKRTTERELAGGLLSLDL